MVFPSLTTIVSNALREDAAFHDVTTRALVSSQARAKAILLAKQDLILCGMPVVQQVFRVLDPKVKFKIKFREGKKVRAGQVIAEISGKARALLSAERVALNFLQHLSGIATLARKYVEAVHGTKAKILDTRKTTPGMRLLERYAVKVGEGINHRFDLRSAVMVKDNHLVLTGSIRKALQSLASLSKKIPTIVEVKNLRELQEALDGKVRHILLDNMSLGQLRSAVSLAKGRCKLEASGGVNLSNVRNIAKTGVDYISVGALTHSAGAVDISLKIH